MPFPASSLSFYWRNEIQMEKYWHKLDRGSLIKTPCITHQLLLLLWWQPRFLPDSLGLKGGWTLGEQVDFSNLSVPLTFPVSLTSPKPTRCPPFLDDADSGYSHPQAIVISIWLWAQSSGSAFLSSLASQSPSPSIPPSALQQLRHQQPPHQGHHQNQQWQSTHFLLGWAPHRSMPHDRLSPSGVMQLWFWTKSVSLGGWVKVSHPFSEGLVRHAFNQLSSPGQKEQSKMSLRSQKGEERIRRVRVSLQLGTWGAKHGSGYEEDADHDVNSTIFCVPNTRLSICQPFLHLILTSTVWSNQRQLLLGYPFHRWGYKPRKVK